MNRLEDYLLPENLIKKREEFIQEIDAIIDDGGISGRPLSLDEIMELESRNYPNVGYEFDDISKDEIEEERLLSELGFKDWVGGIEDEEHYVDHDEIHLSKDREKNSSGELSIIPDYLLNDPEIVGYPDRVTQHQIYDWVRTKLPSQNFSIKDLGCGRGDFFNHLESFGSKLNGKSMSEIDYIGIESNPNLCEVARQKYQGIKIFNTDFNVVSIPTDYTICIGTLNDDHGFDKWEFFNKTLNHALNNTKTAIIFVLQADCYGNEGHLDYGLGRMVSELGSGLRFEIDNSFMEDIYLLTVHIGGFN